MHLLPNSLLGRFAAGAGLFGGLALLLAVSSVAMDAVVSEGSGAITRNGSGGSVGSVGRELISGFVSFGSALVVAGFAFFTMQSQMHHQRTADSRQHRLAKLEELHETLSEIDNFYRDLLADFSWLMDENPPPIESPDEVERVPMPRMLMLADIYAAEAGEELHRVADFAKKIQLLLLDAYASRLRSRGDRAETYNHVGGAITTMMILVDRARNAVTSVAQQVAKER